ncbi:hypothetical protein KIN20_011159 [Parelaphostrongylus tenuis]|uniref:Uncharacterized protein n=1 Tax=Parelaphostrongylus tenuis TaxID=148309 RepID=A0AAD5QLV0_PARTN|nr:hypothetical protein KIN20_011159 [Parelaphostrongylus tenuis]
MADPDDIFWSGDDQLLLDEDLYYSYEEQGEWDTIHQVGLVLLQLFELFLEAVQDLGRIHRENI